MTPEERQQLEDLYQRWAFCDSTVVGRFTASAMRQCADELRVVLGPAPDLYMQPNPDAVHGDAYYGPVLRRQLTEGTTDD